MTKITGIQGVRKTTHVSLSIQLVTQYLAQLVLLQNDDVLQMFSLHLLNIWLRSSGDYNTLLHSFVLSKLTLVFHHIIFEQFLFPWRHF